MDLEHYCSLHTSPEPDHLKLIVKQTWLTQTQPRMLTGHLQGRLYALLSKLIQPNLVIEIGTFTGYGALCFAEGLAPNGLVKTIEANEENVFKSSALIQNSPYKNQIEVIHMEGLPFLNNLKDIADIIFVDAEKKSYIDYIEPALKKLRKGGLLCFDNTLWSSKVANMNYLDTDTQIMRTFNSTLVANVALEVLQLPIRDGFTICQKI